MNIEISGFFASRRTNVDEVMFRSRTQPLNNPSMQLLLFLKPEYLLSLLITHSIQTMNHISANVHVIMGPVLKPTCSFPLTWAQWYEKQMWRLVLLQTSSIPTWSRESLPNLAAPVLLDLSRKVRKQSPVIITSSLMKLQPRCKKRWIRITEGAWSQREAELHPPADLEVKKKLKNSYY